MGSLLLAAHLLVSQDPAALVERLGDESPAVRDWASRELRALGEAAIPALRRVSAGADGETRSRVLDLVDRIEWDGSVDPALLARYPGLRTAFEGGEWERVVEIAVKRHHGLSGYRGDFEAYGIKLLDHPDVRARKAGLDLLGTTYGIARRPIGLLVREIARWDPVESGDESRYWLFCLAHKVYSLGSALDRGLLEGARAAHPDAEEVLRILRARHGVSGAEAALPRLAMSPSPQIARLALLCVRDLKYAPARPQVLARLRKEEDLSLLAGAAQAIEDDSCRQAYAELWRATPASRKRPEHVQLLVRSGAPETVAELLELLEKGPPHFFYYASEGLAALGVHEAVDRLLSPAAPADQRSQFIRCAARIVDASDVGKLVERLMDPDVGIRHNVRYELITLKSPEVRRRLIELLVDENRPVLRDRLFDVVKCSLNQPTLVDAVPDRTLEAVVREGEINAAYNAAELLVRRKGKEAVAVIEESILAGGEKRLLLLKHLVDYPSARVAEAVVKWIDGEIGAYAVVPYLERAGSPEAWAALERMASGSVQPRFREVATAALARLRGEPEPASLLEGYLGGRSWVHYLGRLEADEPGVREEIRRKVRTEGVRWYLKVLGEWAHPEMIPALKKGLLSYDEGLAERVRWEGYPGSCLVSGDEIYGSHWIGALAATGDRSLSGLFVERLADPDEGVRSVAIRTVGRWRVGKGVPLLRRLVRSGDHGVRAQALEALARIGAPGTKEFVLEVLRDNPHAAPHALARLGAKDAIPAIERLLEDPVPHAAVLSALDLLARPEAYAGIDRAVALRRGEESRAWFGRHQETLGIPLRCAPGVSVGLEISRDGTFRGALEWLTGMHQYYGEATVTQRFRDGAIEFCSVADARASWRR